MIPMLGSIHLFVLTDDVPVAPHAPVIELPVEGRRAPTEPAAARRAANAPALSTPPAPAVTALEAVPPPAPRRRAR